MVAGHDEDGDGIPDASDLCPEIASTNVDSDGDGVGDECDPSVFVLGDRITVFGTMQTGDNPFVDTTGWTQEDDAIANNVVGSSELVISRTLGTVYLDVRFNILAINGVATDQHQVGAGITGPTPYYFAQLDDKGAPTKDSGVWSYDMTNGYVQLGTIANPPLLHTGTGMLRIFASKAGAPFWALTAGWGSEVYTTNADTPGYNGGNSIRLDINNLDIEITSVTLIESTL
jgi:hypothetical protein